MKQRLPRQYGGFNNTPLRRHGIGHLANQLCTDKLKAGMDRLLRAILGANQGIYRLRAKVNRWNADPPSH